MTEKDRIRVLELKVNALIWAVGALITTHFLDGMAHWWVFTFP